MPRLLSTAALLLLALWSAAARPAGEPVRPAAADAHRHTTLELAAAPQSCAYVVRSLDGAGVVDHAGSLQRGRGPAGMLPARSHRGVPRREGNLCVVPYPFTVHVRPLPPPHL